MPTERDLRLKAEADNRKLTTENRKLVAELQNSGRELNVVTERLKQSEKSLTTKTVLQQNPAVKELIAQETSRLQSQVQTLQEQNQTIATELKQSKKELSTKTMLKQNPVVQELISQEKTLLQSEVTRKIDEIKNLQLQLERYQYLDTIRPVQKEDFNRFLSASITDLQKELSSDTGEYEFVVRELEVETNVLVETRENKMVFVLPTTKQLNDINPNLMNRLKYALSVVPKE